jgi:hypothetical protein
MDWYDVTGKYHEQTFSHECRLSSLPEEWQRELAAIWRLEADVIGRDGELIKEAGSILPNEVVDRVTELSYEFMDYPEDLPRLGMNHYRHNIDRDAPR